MAVLQLLSHRLFPDHASVRAFVASGAFARMMETAAEALVRSPADECGRFVRTGALLLLEDLSQLAQLAAGERDDFEQPEDANGLFADRAARLGAVLLHTDSIPEGELARTAVEHLVAIAHDEVAEREAKLPPVRPARRVRRAA